MKISVLGCNVGFGAQPLGTAALLVDDDVLVDTGIGLVNLPLDALASIDHIFITHSHFDHIAMLPLMLDAVADLRSTPVTLHATGATIEAIHRHIFNGAICPDFSEIATRGFHVMECEMLRVGQRVMLGNGRSITALPAEHTVPSVGYHLDSGSASLVFTGDTTVNDSFWPLVNQIDNLRYLIIETSFPNRSEVLARASKHLCPRLLFSELSRMSVPAEIFVTHLKPGHIDVIVDELKFPPANPPLTLLRNGRVFEL